MGRSVAVLLSILLVSARLVGDAPSSPEENLLVIVADDLGVDGIGAYGVGTDLPRTPNIDALADEGVLFRRAWSNPLCAPSRSALQTGLYPFRTGIGHAPSPSFALDPRFLTIAEALKLAGYSVAGFGKWHLGNDAVGGAAAPNVAGYDHWAGVKANLGTNPGDYFTWTKIEDGREFTMTGYITTDTVDDAVAWIANATPPWFCVVNFNAPHAPLHAPPAALHSVDFTGVDPPKSEPRPYYRAMVEAMDTEIGRLMANVPGGLEDTTVFFLSDNGTADGVILPPFDPSHGKGTAYEGGVNVPLVVAGAGVSEGGRSSDAIVQLTDLFATLGAMATGIDPATHPSAVLQEDVPYAFTFGLSLPVLPFLVPVDSRSFLEVLRDPLARGPRSDAYAEVFIPNGSDPERYRRAMRETRYKLMINVGAFDPPLPEGQFLFDLEQDPFELQNLLDLPSLTEEQQRAYDELSAELASLLLS